MSPSDIVWLVLITAGFAFWVGRKTAPTTVNETTNDVTINLPADSAALADLTIDHPAVDATLQLPLARAKVWLRAYELATDNSEDYPEDHADRAVEAAFG